MYIDIVSTHIECWSLFSDVGDPSRKQEILSDVITLSFPLDAK